MQVSSWVKEAIDEAPLYAALDHQPDLASGFLPLDAPPLRAFAAALDESFFNVINQSCGECSACQRARERSCTRERARAPAPAGQIGRLHGTLSGAPLRAPRARARSRLRALALSLSLARTIAACRRAVTVCTFGVLLRLPSRSSPHRLARPARPPAPPIPPPSLPLRRLLPAQALRVDARRGAAAQLH